LTRPRGANLATIEVLRHGLIYISEEMGVSLRKSAFSPNIRERADHSCAMLDPQGRTVGQAEQIPVHIGSFPIGLRNTLDYLRKEGVQAAEGEMYAVNDPYIAGTHLNDVVLIRPVFLEGELVGYVANKAHHVDVGGMVPASISPRATELYQEGIVLPPLRIVVQDRIEAEILELLQANSRVPEFTRGDLRAQVAANMLGERRLLEVARAMGLRDFRETCEAMLEQTHRMVLNEYSKLPEGRWHGVDYLELDDELIPIHANVRLSSMKVEVDFAGTHPQVAAPINAVLGVTRAAVTFAIKTLLPPETPLNDGFDRTVIVTAPEGTIVNPIKPAPVAAGNLETSQRIVDVIYRALSVPLPEKIPAASHGSMNNLMMGGVDPKLGRTWAFYETIGGGQGARPGSDGVSGVQVNMTNTLNTPIEVMERYYPLLFVAYQLREGTGGRGTWRGGDGIERAFKATARITVNVLGERSRVRPWGLRGGSPGKPSEYLVRRSDGKSERLRAKDSTILEAGDTLIIRTAGGGSIGRPARRAHSGRDRI
jgi:N-methylhydantoinase B